ncbi:MAG: CopG family transcriptional regulator [Nitrospirae bacterium]|nr:MAG: CopG family transcriptional regulator [Nitrospirota bacterium]
MGRLTITLSDERHRALKEAAARTGKTIRQIVEESLDRYGLQTTRTAAELVAQPRRSAQLPEEEAMATALAETRAGRRERRRR